MVNVDWLPMVAALAGAGVAAGVLAGLLGVGGGIVIVPALDFALGLAGIHRDVALHVAVATSMATIVPTAISSARSHARRAAVDIAIVRRWSVPIVVGALAGSLLASHAHGAVLSGVFGSVAMLAALKMLLPVDDLVLRRTLPGGAAGALLPGGIGLVSAMMGIGGGTLSVPAMTMCGQPVIRAVGTAALLGLWIAVPATAGYLLARPPVDQELPPWTVGYVSLSGFALIAPLTWAMAPVGARIAHSVSRRHLSMAFGAFLFCVAARMLYRAFA